MTDYNKLDEILGQLAEDLISYDTRMNAAGAPPVRFVHKYTSKAKAALTALLDSRIQEARADEVKQARKLLLNRDLPNSGSKTAIIDAWFQDRLSILTPPQDKQ